MDIESPQNFAVIPFFFQQSHPWIKKTLPGVAKAFLGLLLLDYSRNPTRIFRQTKHDVGWKWEREGRGEGQQESSGSSSKATKPRGLRGCAR